MVHDGFEVVRKNPGRIERDHCATFEGYLRLNTVVGVHTETHQFLLLSASEHRFAIAFDHPADEIIEVHAKKPDRRAFGGPLREPVSGYLDAVFHMDVAVQAFSQLAHRDQPLQLDVVGIVSLVKIYLQKPTVLLRCVHDLLAALHRHVQGLLHQHMFPSV